MQHFSELELCSALRTNLARNLFKTPTPVQAQAIPPLLEGRDVVATAQTGTGKTLAFAIPVIEALSKLPRSKSIKALILSPTRELAIQIEQTFRLLTDTMKIRTAVVVGGMSEANQLRDIKAGAEVVIATPGRLCDYLQRRLVNLSTVTMIVLDEADRMLDMGFLPSIRQILKELPAQRQTMLFSATIERSVAHLIESYVKNPVRVSIGTTTRPAEMVDLFCYEVDQRSKFDLLVHLLGEHDGPFLVFTRTKHGADKIAKFLERTPFKTTRIHGDRSQSQRNQALQGFKDGQYRVLVATDVAARGIHVDGIEHVVNYDLPGAAEDFIHRVGRTGRAGARGVSWTFSGLLERAEVRTIERVLGIKMLYKELPPLPQPIGLVRDASTAGNVVVIPTGGGSPKPTGATPNRAFARSFSPRRKSGRR
jgi:ATP-dependent RNA helicase RhlE